jgi:deoxyuridine 5'-triphosphate nucleotidohydrolase
MLLVKRAHPDATLPTRQTAGAAGYDLASVEDCEIMPGQLRVVPTGLVIQVPPGTYGRVAERSGMTTKNHTSVGAGVIDADYRGEVGVVLRNHGTLPVQVQKGQRIAQLILETIVTPAVSEVFEMDETARGAGGFGSTDHNQA